MIRENADSFDPILSPDPITFISVFVVVMYNLVPKDVVRRHEDEVYEVMSKLAGIIVEHDGSLWSLSRSQCLWSMYRLIQALHFQHGYLGSKLRALGCTLSLPEYYKVYFEIDFELQPPLHSC